MVGNNFYLKVIDFGDAKYLGDEIKEIVEEDVFDISETVEGSDDSLKTKLMYDQSFVEENFNSHLPKVLLS